MILTCYGYARYGVFVSCSAILKEKYNSWKTVCMPQKQDKTSIAFEQTTSY